MQVCLQPIDCRNCAATAGAGALEEAAQAALRLLAEAARGADVATRMAQAWDAAEEDALGEARR